ncbi:MAG: TraB/GumN family protein [Thermoplasmata archaeon]
MITIIGVAHVFDISERVKKEIKSRHPSVVAVELDRARYESLKSGERGGDLPLMYKLLSIIQKKIAERYNVKVGEEMLSSIEAANELGSSIALIDLPAQRVFKKLLESMSFKEKIYLIVGSIIGLIGGKGKMEKEIKRYQDNEEKYMDVMESQMPSISKILIDDRNKFMAKNIRELEERFGSVVAVVGDGHISGLIEELDREELEVIRLKEIMKEEKNTDINFSYTYKVES